ncbi:protein-methionine-sulfoxide reductase catalytic subunit MsrP [Nitrogeniibacter mangrovi]|uniref:Protein-methionine-sulfoxide reductase catalytic subunit MsrP n=1 Tax=Nitrogeniibacter mangrovi TaxID=2016596 RepID=A0A6C1BAM6_9RHOO|nr:protein-methionine-sulfoxide reductase catalytic subunit MsrP [Nitrogeniibacter mangrovi]QID19324.1 protein-methionine-sulfoxide reductase catalytic subunit MsrP [Nitrogeniibacter mangrovi]
MLIRHRPDILPSEITPRARFESRRRFLAQGATLAAGASLGLRARAANAPDTTPLAPLEPSPWSTQEALTPLSKVLSYNNFYEFGSSKGDPSLYAFRLPIRPWTITLDGLVHKPKTLDIDQLLKLAPLEERIYRLRCVEAWSMVVPWVGYSLSALLKQVEPLGSARYVRFESYYDPEVIHPHFFGFLKFPYIEGLRLDEAMHPLALLGLGLYGETLPRQNGAPVRVVVPWKYGFKSAKSIVRISFVEDQPLTSWPRAEHNDYGFYANVNPHVDHPHWSQAKERRIGEFFKRDTLMFNGYGDAVASLYAGMDLRRAF